MFIFDLMERRNETIHKMVRHCKECKQPFDDDDRGELAMMQLVLDSCDKSIAVELAGLSSNPS